MNFKSQTVLTFLQIFTLSFGHEGTEVKAKATLPGQEPLKIPVYLAAIKLGSASSSGHAVIGQNLDGNEDFLRRP